jgi:hypothetical protein
MFELNVRLGEDTPTLLMSSCRVRLGIRTLSPLRKKPVARIALSMTPPLNPLLPIAESLGQI